MHRERLVSEVHAKEERERVLAERDVQRSQWEKRLTHPRCAGPKSYPLTKAGYLGVTLVGGSIRPLVVSESCPKIKSARARSPFSFSVMLSMRGLPAL